MDSFTSNGVAEDAHAVKEDLNCTTVEFVYGTTLCFPGEFFTSTQDLLDPSTYFSKLKSSTQCLITTYSPSSLSTFCICHDATQKPLQSGQVCRKHQRPSGFSFIEPSHIEHFIVSTGTAQNLWPHRKPLPLLI